ncbi:carboxylesterase/lipase family protein [Paenibacillus sp. FSL K6-1230]|uniref:carboxylesterase/lipase family protein n=1 Tax=Paenibacillus sp. FSL K6-1230 TaxID=2921603 RepID=UPI0030F68C0B
MSDGRVQTQYGWLQGTEEQGVWVWKGIPYASPPVGELRFKAPEPPSSWEGIRDAAQFGPVCPQPGKSSEGIFGSRAEQPDPAEDCLYLNIWSPALATEATAVSSVGKPVMVWIHGGSFVTGSGSMSLYDGRTLAQQGDVVVVTINYRLGPLGFLHLSSFDPELASNAGLLDQVAALRWVQENITAFGGDPENVTVFGESAGAMSIGALLAMPSAKGLFQRAIMQSGASQVLEANKAHAIAAAFLKELGVEQPTVEHLSAIPLEDITMATYKLHQKVGSAGITLLFQPVVDGNTLPEEPLSCIQSGQGAQVPLLIGTNLDEGAYFVREPEHLISPEMAVQAIYALTGLENGEELLRYYPMTVEGQSKFMTELYFWRSAVQYASAQARHQSVWMYRFDWSLAGHPFLGKAVHGAEIAFVFGNLELLTGLGIHLTEDMKELSRQMLSAWAAFARTGDPATAALQWPAYETTQRVTAVFDQELSLVSDPDADKRRQFTGEAS